MTDPTAIPGERVCSFIERVERIDEEIRTLNDGKKEVFSGRLYPESGRVEGAQVFVLPARSEAGPEGRQKGRFPRQPNLLLPLLFETTPCS